MPCVMSFADFSTKVRNSFLLALFPGETIFRFDGEKDRSPDRAGSFNGKFFV